MEVLYAPANQYHQLLNKTATGSRYQVWDAARRGKLRLALVAPDASRHSRGKVLPLLMARRIRVVEGPTAAALGAAVGKESAAAVGIIDASLAAGVRKLLDPGSGSGRQSGSGWTR